MGRLRALALLVVAGTAAAQPSPAQKQQASSLVKQAIAKSQAGDHATAIDLYLQAYALIPQPLLLSNIGSEYQALGDKPVEAVKYFCKYLEADPTGGNASYATAQVKVLQQQLGNQVDDKDVCHPVVPPPPPPDHPPNTGDTAGTGSGAQVTGTAGLATPAAAEHAGGSTGLEVAGLGLSAAGAIALGVGIYYGIQAKHASDLISNHKVTDPWPANIRQIEADGQSDENKQIGFMIGGGAALAAGVVLYVVGRSRASSPQEHVSLAPVVTPSAVGLSLGGSY